MLGFDKIPWAPCLVFGDLRAAAGRVEGEPGEVPSAMNDEYVWVRLVTDDWEYTERALA